MPYGCNFEQGKRRDNAGGIEKEADRGIQEAFRADGAGTLAVQRLSAGSGDGGGRGAAKGPHNGPRSDPGSRARPVGESPDAGRVCGGRRLPGRSWENLWNRSTEAGNMQPPKKHRKVVKMLFERPTHTFL